MLTTNCHLASCTILWRKVSITNVMDQFSPLLSLSCYLAASLIFSPVYCPVFYIMYSGVVMESSDNQLLSCHPAVQATWGSTLPCLWILRVPLDMYPWWTKICTNMQNILIHHLHMLLHIYWVDLGSLFTYMIKLGYILCNLAEWILKFTSRAWTMMESALKCET